MASPAHEIPEPRYNYQNSHQNHDRSSEEDNTIVGDNNYPPNPPHLTLDPSKTGGQEDFPTLKSPSQTRERAHRLDDDLRMLQVERQVTAQIEDDLERDTSSKSVKRERSKRVEVIDEFDVATNPLHEKAQVYKPPENPDNNFALLFKKIHNSNVLVRYFTYIVPLVLIILVPLLIAALLPAAQRAHANVGGVRLVWFCVWLEVVWLTLWAGRILAKLIPYPGGLVASLFTNNSKKWRDMIKQLEMALTLFFWQLGVQVSFLPIMRNKQVQRPTQQDQDHVRTNTEAWTKPMNKVLISFFVLAILNLVEKIVIQLIAISFHLRTYADRIEINKFQIGSLTKLYQFSKAKIAMEDSDFEAPSGGGPASGQRTPAILEKAQKNTKEAFNKFGDVAGRVAGDFTGKAVKQSGHPQQVVLNLLSTTGGSQILARRLYRTFAREETETVFGDDLKHAFESEDEADAAFSMFDKDLNGDISMEELEAVCVEIGRERKSITASLKDLDSVVSKLDAVLIFIVLIIVILVFVSLIASASSGVLTSAGSAVLGLSWLFATTAQEFLQSIIFVFVKHPFDVGDRVTIYGNTGSKMTGDDYFVKSISLLYTEFKKMEGHVVQAPNSYLNELFILNVRRSGGLAEAVPMTFKYGTTLDQIETLRSKLLEFVKAEKREYQANILTELREVSEAHAITLNIIFFFKSNWQNELLRLQRRNKFICALMISMQELGIEGPRMRFPGQKESFPVYTQSMPFNASHSGHGGTPDFPDGKPKAHDDSPLDRTHGSTRRPRGESLAAMGRRVDFSLGMSSIAAGDLVGDVHDDRDADTKAKIPINVSSPSPSRKSHQSRDRSGSRARSSGRARTFSVSQLHNQEGRSSLHRNRFFGGRKSGEHDRMENGMAGIPEGPTGAESSRRMDPRSGTISPQAMHLHNGDMGENPSTMFQTGNSATIHGQETTSMPDPSAPASTQAQDFHPTRL